MKRSAQNSRPPARRPRVAQRNVATARDRVRPASRPLRRAPYRSISKPPVEETTYGGW